VFIISVGFLCQLVHVQTDIVAIYLFIHLFIHYASEAAHITLQTYKIKHKVKIQSIKNSKNTTQQRNQIQISTDDVMSEYATIMSLFTLLRNGIELVLEG